MREIELITKEHLPVINRILSEGKDVRIQLGKERGSFRITAEKISVRFKGRGELSDDAGKDKGN